MIPNSRTHPFGLALLLLALVFGCASGSHRQTAANSNQEPGVSVSLDSLMDRSMYAELDDSAAEAIAFAAARRWNSKLSKFQYMGVERFSAGGHAHWMSLWKHERTGLEFVLVPGGRFQMGSPATELNREADENQNWVTLSPFLLSRTECSKKTWANLADNVELNPAPAYFQGSSSHPVENVSAEEVDAWCTEAGLELPTEAQWEHACRAGTTKAYTFGHRIDPSQGRVGEQTNNDFESGPVPVGTLIPNAFGLFHMHGNLWEWCRDNYLDYLVPPKPKAGLRTGPSTTRVIRGGTYFNGSKWARSAARAKYTPDGKSRLMGFRPSLDLPY